MDSHVETSEEVNAPQARARSGSARESVVTQSKGDAAQKSTLMTRTMLNFWLDAGMLVVFILLLWASTVVRFVFPPAVTAAEYTLWGWTVDQWIGFQYAVLCLFTFLILLHLMLHWTWVCGVLAARFLKRDQGKKRNVDDGTRTLWGVGLLIVLLNIMGIGIAAASLMIQGPL
jgi:hypothetical protein